MSGGLKGLGHIEVPPVHVNAIPDRVPFPYTIVNGKTPTPKPPSKAPAVGVFERERRPYGGGAGKGKVQTPPFANASPRNTFFQPKPSQAKATTSSVPEPSRTPSPAPATRPKQQVALSTG